MADSRKTKPALPLAAVVVGAALVVLGAITVGLWIFSYLMNIVKFALVTVVVVGVIAWVISAKANR